MRGEGVWTDSDGGVRNASMEIVFTGDTAKVTIAAMDDPGVELPSQHRAVTYFLGRMEEQLRVTQYRNREIVPDPKPGKGTAKKR
jgi:hypothetical protein